MMDREIEGGCLCGTVRYRLTGEPLFATLCHCRSCRLAAGAPSLAWVILRADEFTVTSGSPVPFQSSPDAIRTFCGTCGTSLTYQRTARQDLIDVTTISLDNPDEFPPDREIWVESKVSWETLNGALPHYAASSLGATPIEYE
jgi:hypothetical protein